MAASQSPRPVKCEAGSWEGPRCFPSGSRGEENGLRGPGRKKREKPAEGREARGIGNYGGDNLLLGESLTIWRVELKVFFMNLFIKSSLEEKKQDLSSLSLASVYCSYDVLGHVPSSSDVFTRSLHTHAVRSMLS